MVVLEFVGATATSALPTIAGGYRNLLTLGGPSGSDTLLEGLRLTRGVYGRRANPCPQKIQWQGQGQQSPRLARRSKGYAGEY